MGSDRDKNLKPIWIDSRVSIAGGLIGYSCERIAPCENFQSSWTDKDTCHICLDSSLVQVEIRKHRLFHQSQRE